MPDSFAWKVISFKWITRTSTGDFTVNALWIPRTPWTQTWRCVIWKFPLYFNLNIRRCSSWTVQPIDRGTRPMHMTLGAWIRFSSLDYTRSLSAGSSGLRKLKIFEPLAVGLANCSRATRQNQNFERLGSTKFLNIKSKKNLNFRIKRAS